MLKKLTVVALIITCSAVINVLTSNHHIAGRDVGGTKSLLSYSQVNNNELLYPPEYLQAGTIIRGEDGLCTAVNSLPTEARGWPLYYAVDDPNCGITKLFPVVFLLNTLLFSISIGLFFVGIRRLIQFKKNIKNR